MPVALGVPIGPPTGTQWCLVTTDPLPVAEALAWAVLPGCGGVVTFCGTVRDHSDGRDGVVSLEYECYEEHAVDCLGRVASSARERWPVLGRVALLHRVGKLAVGDVSVVVVVSAPHRGEAFDAARHCIDMLKQTVPIWKREAWSGGSDWATCAHDLPRRSETHVSDRGGGLVAVSEVRARVLAGRVPLPPRSLALAHAGGCVTAEAIVAAQALPPFAASAMDGYALRAADTLGAPVDLEVIGELMAGSFPDRPVRAGQAVRIMTGAPLPEGADAICMIERAIGEAGGRRVTITYELKPGEYVRPAGSNIGLGDAVFPAGTALTPGALGVLAGLGMPEVLVHPRPRVGVISTGDELVEGPGPLGPGKIHDSNRASLLALVEQSGCTPVDLGIVADDKALVAAALLDAASRCDALLASGGVSVGDSDVVKAVLADISGGTMQWFQVAVRPGKPFAYGEIGPLAIPVFGLPGNPVSAMVSFELFARPALRAMAGHHTLDRPMVDAVCDEDFSRVPDGKLHLVRVVAGFGSDGFVHVGSAGGQESHHLHAMARANALALLPDGVGADAGTRVRTMLLDADGLEHTGAPRSGPAWAQ